MSAGAAITRFLGVSRSSGQWSARVDVRPTPNRLFQCYLGQGTSPEQCARARDAAVAFLATHGLCKLRLNLPPAAPLTWPSGVESPTELPIIRLRQELRRAVVEAGLLPIAQDEPNPDRLHLRASTGFLGVARSRINKSRWAARVDVRTKKGVFQCYLGEGTSPEQAARARDAAVAFLAQHDLCSFRLNLPPAVPLTWKSDLGNPTELPIIRLRQELRRAVVEAGLLPLAQEDTPDGEEQDARPKRLTRYIGVRNKPVTYLQDGSSVTYHQGVVRDGWVLLCPCVHTNISLLCVPSVALSDSRRESKHIHRV